jgi:shikimate dehydrogenase
VELNATPTVVDLAYRPDGAPTALVAAAQVAGCTVVDGLEVLVRQGAASFERWTGIEAPLDAMRNALR